MISGTDPDAPTDRITFTAFDLADESRREAVFALGNGVLGVRGAAPDARIGERRYAGTYRAGLYNRLTSTVMGQEVSNESLVNLPNWLLLQFRFGDDGEWFSLETAELLDYRHSFLFEDATTTRSFRLRDRQGRTTRITEKRFVSMDRAELAALRLSIEPEGWSGSVTLRSGIDGRVSNAKVREFAPYNNRHLVIDEAGDGKPGVLMLRARTDPGRLPILVATRTETSLAPSDRRVLSEGEMICEIQRFAITAERPLVVAKLAAVTAGDGLDDRDVSVLVESAPPFAVLLERHHFRWQAIWGQIAFQAENPDLHKALRFHFLHLLQTVSPLSTGLDAGFPARGWEEGYHGQIFWDELFVFPIFSLRFPELARVMLQYRFARLDAARALARDWGYRGAMFPWRSASKGGEETPRYELNPQSERWMRDDTNRQRHIGAAVAHDVWSYYAATGDHAFLRDHGAEMLVEIARFWASIAERDEAGGRYSISGVVGPDEYHTLDPATGRPGLRDNAYTNLMAAWTLVRAEEALEQLTPEERAAVERRLGVEPDEREHWQEVSRRLRIVFHADGVISQFDGFEGLKAFDLEEYRRLHGHDRVDWALEKEGRTVSEVQVAKQADLLMLFYLLPLADIEGLLERLCYPVTRAQLLATARYYVGRTSHDSSLSRVAMAGAFAKLDPALSWHFYEETMRPELVPANRSSGNEGVHLGAMAGTIDVLQRCYLGLQVDGRGLTLDPSIPPALGPVTMAFVCRNGRFTLRWTGQALVVASDPDNLGATPVWFEGDEHALMPGRAVAVRPPVPSV